MMSAADKQAILDAMAEQLCLCAGIIEQIGSKIGMAMQRSAINANTLIEGTIARITRVALRQSNKAADLLHSTQCKIENCIKDNSANCTAIIGMILKKIEKADVNVGSGLVVKPQKATDAAAISVDKGCCDKIAAVLDRIAKVLEEIRNRIPYAEHGEKGDVEEYVANDINEQVEGFLNG